MADQLLRDISEALGFKEVQDPDVVVERCREHLNYVLFGEQVTGHERKYSLKEVHAQLRDEMLELADVAKEHSDMEGYLREYARQFDECDLDECYLGANAERVKQLESELATLRSRNERLAREWRGKFNEPRDDMDAFDEGASWTYGRCADELEGK